MVVWTAGLVKGRIEALTDESFTTVMTVLSLSMSISSFTGTTKVGVIRLEPGANRSIVCHEFLHARSLLGQESQPLPLHKDRRHYFPLAEYHISSDDRVYPISTELIGRFPTAEISAIIYGANMIATGVCTQGIWFYAQRRKLLVSEGPLNEKVMDKIRRRLKSVRQFMWSPG